MQYNFLSIGKSKKWKKLFASLLILILAFFLLPLPKNLQQEPSLGSLRIEDRNGLLLYEVRGEQEGSSTFVHYDDIPKGIIEAVTAIEDRTFFWHFGISIRSIARALYQNISSGKIVSGGSTITQQLVRNSLKPDRRGFAYKIKEALFAIKLDAVLSKAEIMERYLNTAYFGHNAYGISHAAHVYFGKSLHELSMAEISLLVGLLQSPSALDPFSNFEAAKKRQQIVLRSLVDVGHISADEYREMRDTPLRLAKDRVPIAAPHFVMWLLSEYTNEIQNKKTVRTTIDLPLQKEVERVIDYQLEILKDKNVTSAAVVIIDAVTGELLTMIGSADYFNEEHDGQVNSALAARQPGSTLKPFTYALALEQGDTAATVVADTDLQLLTQEGNPYTPRNYDYEHHGLVRYREALANSYNIPAVKVLQKVGVDRLLQLLRRAGITTLTKEPNFYGVALTLGDGEVKLLELARAYSIFINQGRALGLKVLFDEMQKNQKPKTKNQSIDFAWEDSGNRIISEQTAWLITNILSDHDARIAEFGMGNLLEFDFPVAAKTGTTRNARDNWLIGYSPQRIVGVWVGNADNSPMKGTSGITGAGPIFRDAMLLSMRGIPYKNFKVPEGIERIEICETSGKLSTDLCENTIYEYFRKGSVPTEHDDMHTLVSIDTRNGLLGDGCEFAYIEKKVFTIFPPELQKWAREEGYEQVPGEVSPLCGDTKTKNEMPKTNIFSGIKIIQPATGDSFKLDPLVPDESEKIIFEAQANSSVEFIDWYINDEYVGRGTAPDYTFQWKPSVGRFTVTAKREGVEDSVIITIEN